MLRPLAILSKEIRLQYQHLSSQVRRVIRNDGKSEGVPALADGQYCDYVWLVDVGIDSPCVVALETLHVGYWVFM